MARPREPLDRPWALVLIVALYAASIPWWAPGGVPSIWLGTPSWALVSLACTLAAAGLVAFSATRHWKDR